MGLIVTIGLIFMIITTLVSFTNKKFMEEHNKDGKMGLYLLIALAIEVLFLIWMLGY